MYCALAKRNKLIFQFEISIVLSSSADISSFLFDCIIRFNLKMFIVNLFVHRHFVVQVKTNSFSRSSHHRRQLPNGFIDLRRCGNEKYTMVVMNSNRVRNWFNFSLNSGSFQGWRDILQVIMLNYVTMAEIARTSYCMEIIFIWIHQTWSVVMPMQPIIITHRGKTLLIFVYPKQLSRKFSYRTHFNFLKNGTLCCHWVHKIQLEEEIDFCLKTANKCAKQ